MAERWRIKESGRESDLGNLSVQTGKLRPRKGGRTFPRTHSSLVGDRGLEPRSPGRQVRLVPSRSRSSGREGHSSDRQKNATDDNGGSFGQTFIGHVLSIPGPA